MTEPLKLAAIVRVHVQCNADYGSEPHMRVRPFPETATLKEVVDWYKVVCKQSIGSGQLTIVETEDSK